MKKKFDQKFEFINKRFPVFFRDSFDAEREAIYKLLTAQIQESELKGDYQSFYTTIGPIVEKINKVYGLSLEQREFLAAVFHRLSFEEENIFSLERIVFLSNLPAVEKGRNRMKNFQLNWRTFYEFIQRFYLSNERISFISSHQSMAQYNTIVKTIRRNRIYFADDNMFELLDIYREKGHPYEKFTGLLYFNLFSKFTKKTSPEAYEKLLEEFIRIANYLDPIYLDLFAKILRFHKSIKWEKYYVDLYSLFLNFVESLLPTADKSRSNIFLNSSTIYAHLQLKSPIVVIPEIMVHLLLPENHPNHKKIWDYCERLFSLIDDFIHPQDESKFTAQILCFYSIFISKYISRFRFETSAVKRNQNLLKKLENKKNNQTVNEEDHEEEVILEPELEEEEKIRSNDDEDMDDHFKEAEMDEDDEETENDDENQEEEKTESNEKPSEKDETIPEIHDKEYFLDESCHNRFMEIVKPILKYLVFLRETKEGSIINICLKLCYFKPYEVMPILIKTIYSAFENPEMTFSTIYKILLIIIKPLLTRSVYKPGLYELRNLLRITNENIMASNWRQTYLVIKLYHRIFSLVPLCDVEDLKENYLKFRPNSNEEELKVELNKDEDIDMWQFMDDLSDLALEYFKKILSILEFIEKPKNKEERSLRTLFINQHNKFWSFFFQSSPRLFKKYLYMIAETLDDKIQIKAQEYYAYFLNGCSLKDPKQTLDLIIPMLFSKLIKKRKTPYDLSEFSKFPTFFLLKNSRIQPKILEYEREVLNKDIRLWYLNLLEDAISFGREYIESHEESLEIILIHYFFDEEIVIFEKISNILQKIILSLTAIYPMELRCWNSKEYESEEYSVFFYKKIGEAKSQNFEVNWHESTKKERNFALSWVFRTLPTIMSHFQQDFFSQESFHLYDYDKDFSLIIDRINLKLSDPSQNLKNEVWRLFIIIDQVLGAINMRCPQGCDPKLEENQVYLKFKEGFLFEEYYTLNAEILDFCKKCFSFFLDSHLINDVQIMGLYLKVVAHLIGEDQYNSKMLSLKKWIKTELRIYRNPLEPSQGDLRLIKILSCTVALYTRIYSYSFNMKLSDDYAFLQDILLITFFHPYEKVSGKSSPDLLDRVTMCSRDWRQDTDKMLYKILGFIGDKLDIDSPYSITKKSEINGHNDQDHKTSVQAYLTIIIQAFDRIMNVYEIQLDSEFFNHILRIFCCYEYIEHQTLQNKLFEIFLLKFFYVFENIVTHPVYNIDHKLKEKVLLKSSKSFKDYVKVISENPQPQKIRRAELAASAQIYTEIIKTAINKLSDEKTHWKQKIIYGLIGIALSTVLDPSCDDFKELLRSFMGCLNSDHQFLRQMARPGLLKLYRLMKRLYVEKKEIRKISHEDFKAEKKTMDEFLNMRFLRKKDLEECSINDNFLGSFDYYSQIECRNKWKEVKEPHFYELFKQKEFCSKIIENLVLDIGILQDNSGQNRAGGNFGAISSRFMSEIQTFMNSFFNKNKKKANNLKQFEIPYEVYVRFLQKIFQFYGQTFYDHTIDLIVLFSTDYNCKEKQITVSSYINALLKTIHIWPSPTNRDSILDFVSEKIVFNCLENASLENYQTWIYNLYNVCYYRDFREIEPFFTKILGFLWIKSQQNPVKMQRYISLTRLICSNYGFRARDFSQKALVKIVLENEPSDIKQVAETSLFLSDVIRWGFLVPINYKKIKEDDLILDIEKIVTEDRKDEFFIDEGGVIFEKNKNLWDAFRFLEKKLAASENERKNYMHLISGLVNKVLKKRINLMMFEFMEVFISYHFEFKDEDVTDQTVLKILNDNIPYLGRLRYSKEVLPKIFAIFEKNLNNEYWRIRLRAMTFYHHFIFNNFFFLSFEKLLNPLLTSLVDENPSVSNLSMKILSDLLKLASKKEIIDCISCFTEKAKINIDPERKEESLKTKTIGIYSLMCLLLAFPNEIYTWSEGVLDLVLRNKKITKSSQSKIKEFCSKFWKNRAVYLQLSDIKLSEDMMVTLTEIANPYNYFA